MKSNFLKFALLLGVVYNFNVVNLTAVDALPREPVEIGSAPQFFVDDYMVFNRWAVRPKYSVVRKFHQPVKHPKNPMLEDVGYINVIYDADKNIFRCWYQTACMVKETKPRKARYGIAYAKSKDGITWTKPELKLVEWQGSKKNNLVMADLSGCFLLDIPKEYRRGYKYLMLVNEKGFHLIGSHDGINWDTEKAAYLGSHLRSDSQNSIVYDSLRKEFVMSCRPRPPFWGGGNRMIAGASRRVARLSNSKLWTEWPGTPQTILIPDKIDTEKRFNFFYGMPLTYKYGIYWGCLWPFKLNTDIYTEMVYSRNGINYTRLPGRPPLIPLGKNGEFDDGMTFATGWVEYKDEWRFYYCGHDGPHGAGANKRTARMGMASVKRGRLVSLYGPESKGGVVCTRMVKWPGGKLLLNVKALNGVVKVRIIDRNRKDIPGFTYKDSVSFTGDALDHEVRWEKASIESMKGKCFYIEIFLRDADLFSFRATGGSPDTVSKQQQPGKESFAPEYDKFKRKH